MFITVIVNGNKLENLAIWSKLLNSYVLRWLEDLRISLAPKTLGCTVFYWSIEGQPLWTVLNLFCNWVKVFLTEIVLVFPSKSKQVKLKIIGYSLFNTKNNCWNVSLDNYYFTCLSQCSVIEHQCKSAWMCKRS